MHSVGQQRQTAGADEDVTCDKGTLHHTGHCGPRYPTCTARCEVDVTLEGVAHSVFRFGFTVPLISHADAACMCMVKW